VAGGRVSKRASKEDFEPRWRRTRGSRTATTTVEAFFTSNDAMESTISRRPDG
jgi:hypothetical protein